MKTSAEAPGMTGRLRLVVGLDGAGRCALRERFASTLHRVLRVIPGDVPEEGLVVLLNPSGGIAQGDVLEADVRVEGGAHAIVTSPGATNVYRMDRGNAVSRARFRVAEGSVLEYLPRPLIPHRGARFTEEVSFDLDSGGRLLAWEILSPGRTAGGEVLEYEFLGLRLEVRLDGGMVLRERGELRPAAGMRGGMTLGSYNYYGVLLVYGGEAAALEGSLKGMSENTGRLFSGVTRLKGGGVMMKALSLESEPLANLFHAAREAILPQLCGRKATSLRG